MESKFRVRVRIVGRLWMMPPIPFGVAAVVLCIPPDAVRVSVNGGAPHFCKVERDAGDHR
jgi:hypothetical protein